MEDAEIEMFDPPRMKEAMAFYRMKKELRRKYLGQWVIIHGLQHVGDGYDSYESARAAAEGMGLKPRECLIIRVVGADTIILSHG